MSFFDEDPVDLPKTRYELRERKMARQRMLMVCVIGLFLVAIITYVLVIATNGHFEHKVTKTSPNTWHVEDPNNEPEKWLGETCASEGKTIANLSARANDYDSLDVVCK